MRRGGGEWRGAVAFFAFDALSLGVADVRMHANAGWSAFHIRASFGHLRIAVDQERQRRSAAGHAVQLVTAFGGVHLAIGGAFALSGLGEKGHRCSFAVGSLDAHALSVLHVSLLAEAANDAVAGAGWSRVRFGARCRASGTASVEFFVLTALHWWHHHERFRLWHGGAFAGHNAFSVIRSEVSLLASATADADTRADWVGVLAGAVASLAFTIFLVGVADHGRHHHGFFGRHAAVLRFGADAFFVFQVAGFAEASSDAVLGAHFRMRLGAGRWAGRAAAEENLVLGALRHLRRVGEEHGGFTVGGEWRLVFAFLVFDALSLVVADVGMHANASWSAFHFRASLGYLRFAVDQEWDWRFAASHAVHFVTTSDGVHLAIAGALALSGGFRGGGDLIVELEVGCIAEFFRDAFAVDVLQESSLTETTADTLHGTDFGYFRISAIRNAGGAAG